MPIQRFRRTVLALVAVAGLGLAPAARAETSPTVPLVPHFRPLIHQIWGLLAGLLGPVDTTEGGNGGVQNDKPHNEGSGIDPDGGRHR